MVPVGQVRVMVSKAQPQALYSSVKKNVLVEYYSKNAPLIAVNVFNIWIFIADFFMHVAQLYDINLKNRIA